MKFLLRGYNWSRLNVEFILAIDFWILMEKLR